MTTVVPVPVRAGPPPRAHPRRHQPRPILTPRLRQVLALAANGNTNRAIGRQLGTDEDTVKTQMRTILRLLHVDDRAQATAVALRLGVLDLADIRIPAGIAHHHATPRRHPCP